MPHIVKPPEVEQSVSVAQVMPDSLYSAEPVTEEELKLWRNLWEWPTPRQREVTEYVLSGLTNVQIGKLLHISVRTVESHRQEAMAKLGLTARSGTCKRAAFCTRARLFWGLKSIHEQVLEGVR